MLRRVRRETLGIDGFLGEVAVRQHGVVSIAQLRALGLRQGAIEHRVRAGRLHRVHRGVYAVGHPRISPRGRLWAAVLATAGILSHRAAAALWDLMPFPLGAIDVTSRRRAASVDGIRVHRSRSAEAVLVDGLPVTTVGRTLLDLADVLDAHRLERACHRAEHLRLLDLATIPDLPGRSTAKLRRALATLEHASPDVTSSAFEERFLAFLNANELPRPRTNTRIAHHEVDFLWPDARLIVETDGAATHLTARAFQRDRERDFDLTARGYRVVRITWRQLTLQPDTVARRLRSLLARPSP